MSRRSIALVWSRGPVRGSVELIHGGRARLEVDGERGGVEDDRFTVPAGASARVEVTVEDPRVDPGPGRTRLTVRSDRGAFTFFLSDVSAKHPIHLPNPGVCVTDTDDQRDHDAIVASIRAAGSWTELQKLEAAPELSFDAAAKAARTPIVPTWLGIGQDIRLFEVGYRPEDMVWGFVRPRLHGMPVRLEENGRERSLHYDFALGRGVACLHDVSARLEDGVLPILHGRATDGEIRYDLTAFAALRDGDPNHGAVSGTHFLVADAHAMGHMFTEAQQREADALIERWRDEPGEPVLLLMRVEAVNTGSVPRYAWCRAPRLASWPNDARTRYDGEAGMATVGEGERVICAARLGGRPLPHDEMAVLLPPEGRAVFEFVIPHTPVTVEEARSYHRIDFDKRLGWWRAYWRAKRASAARIELPEPAVHERVQASLLHLDLVAYGREPDGPVAPCIGVYCPIGSESSPIVQFFDSVGWGGLAERSLEYFLRKQHDDGFMQNFGGYTLETGAALWSMGEHYRYTRDVEWVRRVREPVERACEYLRRWRHADGIGGGLQAGKVADPEDPFHSFMLNGYSCLGISRAAEMLAAVDPAASKRWADEARAYRTDIRAAFAETMARSPVVPLGDGTWVPAGPPWTEAAGAMCLFAEPERAWTHGCMTARDSLLGPLYLVVQEVLDAEEPLVTAMLDAHAELMTVGNVGLSQPYYCRHDWVHLKRGQVKAFLADYYHAMAALSDHQSYSWWEHLQHVSPHKTHEEAWFLMQTRWMLMLEQGEGLRLLPGAPRAWLGDGRRIAFDGLRSYFGPVSLTVESQAARDRIRATVACGGERRPKWIDLRLPHPQGRRARSCVGGEYASATETVRIEPFAGEAEVVLSF